MAKKKKEQYQHGQEYKKKEKERAALKKGGQGGLRLVLALLILLVILSTCMTVWRLYYVCLRDDYEVALRYDDEAVSITLFSMEYRDGRGDIIVQSLTDENVIAPGSVSEITVGFINKDDVAIDYDFVPTVSISESYPIPMEFRILDNTGRYVAGDLFTWISVKDIGGYKDSRTLKKGEKITYTLQWRWPFEDDRDDYDTALGNKLDGNPLLITVTFDAVAQINTSVEANDGSIESVISSGVFRVLLWVVLTVLYLVLTAMVVMRLLTAKVDLLTIQQNYMPDGKVTVETLKKKGIIKKRVKFLVITDKSRTQIRFAVNVYAHRYENDSDLRIVRGGGMAKLVKEKKKKKK